LLLSWFSDKVSHHVFQAPFEKAEEEEEEVKEHNSLLACSKYAVDAVRFHSEIPSYCSCMLKTEVKTLKYTMIAAHSKRSDQL
jgi:hypothetical protein